MTTVLYSALWLHMALCVLLAGTSSMWLMAGQPKSPALVHWERITVRLAHWVVLAAITSGLVAVAAQTSLFEGRSSAAIEPSAILRVLLETRSGLVWSARLGLLALVGGFLVSSGDADDRIAWQASRIQVFALASVALVLHSTSGHLAAISESFWPQVSSMAHLFAAGLWAGGVPPLALLLVWGSGGSRPLDPQVIRTLRRFSRLAMGAIIVLAATGLHGASILDDSAAGLAGTMHGRLLLAKLALFAPALFLAALSRSRLSRLMDPAISRPVALLVAAESVFIPAILGLAVALSMTTPARHSQPDWPFPFQVSFANLDLVSAMPWPLVIALVALIFLIILQRSAKALAVALALGIGVSLTALGPIAQEAFPTTFARSPFAYDVATIAAGKAVYSAKCASCHGDNAVELIDRQAEEARRSAGDLFWLISPGSPVHTRLNPVASLTDAQRWQVVNFLRAAEANTDSRGIGPTVEIDKAWLAAPDATISVGPLAPIQLSSFRSKRMVLLVLYTLPASRDRLSQIAKQYGALSVLGAEVIAAAPTSSPDAIAILGQSPPILFPIVTNGNEDIAAAYRLIVPGANHAEFLIDRQGYIRAVWRGDIGSTQDVDALQAAVERLNEEKAPPILPDNHIHG